MSISEFLDLFLLRVADKNLFMDEVGHLKTILNVALWLTPFNNLRVIAPIVRNACYCYCSETIINTDLVLLPISSVHLEGSTIYSYRKSLRPPSSSYTP